ncbi:MAG TPA: nucleotidyltransferase domain-containing protein [Cytophagales bacterium]|nr:nucleotidyltransferase domain-containing protein [Cytophagales bacterium]
MQALAKLEEVIKGQLPILKEKYNVKSIGIFGKVEDDRDLDLLVEFENAHHPGYFKFYDMERYLSGLLNMSVGLVPREQLRKRLDKHILADLVS